MEHVVPILMVTLGSGAIAILLQQQAPPKERPVIMASWVMHFLFTWANLALVLFYYGRGDMLAFHKEGITLANMARIDPIGVTPEIFKMILQREYRLNFHVAGSGGTGTMVGITSLLCIGLQDSLLGISLFMCMASFVGKALLLTAIRPLFPPQLRLGVSICIMLVPSAVFWTAGIIKESFVITAMGVAAFGLALSARRVPIGYPIAIVGVMFVALLKAYILMVAAIAIGAWWYWDRSVQRGKIEIKPIQFVVGIGMGVVGMLVVGQIFPRFSIDNLATEALELQSQGHRGGSKFSLGVDTISGPMQIIIAPYAMFTGMFRPALFDVRNAQMLANALESTALLVMVVRGLFALQYTGLLRTLVRYPFLVFCALFAMGMGMGVGLATANLGTLSRYRMPLIPFLAIFAYVVSHRSTVLAAAKPVAAAPTLPTMPARKARTGRMPPQVASPHR